MNKYNGLLDLILSRLYKLRLGLCISCFSERY